MTVKPDTQLLTTRQAADLLNVSQRHFAELARTGVIASTLVGRHHRVTAKDLNAYLQIRDAQRDAALEALAKHDATAL